MYIDGVIRDAQCGLTYYPGANYWVVGFPNTPTTIADLRVYNRALSQAEATRLSSLIAQGLTANSGSLQTGLAEYWPMGSACPCTGTINANVMQTESTGPTVAITTPLNGGTITGAAVTVTATATDPIGVNSVQFQVDGSNAGALLTSAPYTISFDSTKLVDGPGHTIVATATNAGGITSTSQVNVTSSNGVSEQNWYFAVAGSDSNNCKTTGTACKTLAHVATLTMHESDHVLFNGGDTFTGCVSLNGTNTLSRPLFPVIFDSYGTGPAILTTQGSGCTSADGRVGIIDITAGAQGIQLNGVPGTSGLKLVCDSTGAAGIGVYISSYGGATNWITLNGVEITGLCHDGISANFDAAILVDPTSGNRVDNVALINTVIHGPSGPADLVDNGLFTFGPQTANTYRAIQGNYIYNIGGQPSSASSGNGLAISTNQPPTAPPFSGNVIHDTGANGTTCGGPVLFGTFFADSIYWSQNEGYNSIPYPTFVSGCDHDGIDFDLGTTNSTAKYNYIHNTFGEGIYAFVEDAYGPINIGFNIVDESAQTASNTQSNAIAVAWGYPATPAINVFNNSVTCPGSTAGFCFFHGFTDTSLFPGVIANNIFNSLNGNFVYLEGLSYPGLHMLSNDYYTTHSTKLWRLGYATYATTFAAWQAVAPGGEVGSITTNPAWVGPTGTNVTCNATAGTTGPQPCPAGYALSGGSPAHNTGTDLTSYLGAGWATRDYYGTTLPSGGGTGFPIGAAI
jgi:hypothetical protein